MTPTRDSDDAEPDWLEYERSLDEFYDAEAASMDSADLPEVC